MGVSIEYFHSSLTNAVNCEAYPILVGQNGAKTASQKIATSGRKDKPVQSGGDSRIHHHVAADESATASSSPGQAPLNTLCALHRRAAWVSIEGTGITFHLVESQAKDRSGPDGAGAWHEVR